MNYMLCSRPGTCFFKAVSPSLVTKDAAYIATELDKCYTEMLELKVPGTVAACVTDKATVMGKARETLEANEETRERWAHVSHGGCLLHWLDLVFEDIVQITFFAGAVETAREILKFFWSHTRPADLLRKHQKLQYNCKTFEPALPGETRMGTNYIVLQFVVTQMALLSPRTCTRPC